MSKVAVSESNLTDIADSIRTKLKTQDTYTPAQMSGAIDSIPTGESVVSPTFVSFQGYTGGSSIDISWLRTDKMTSMSGMFKNCGSLLTIDTSKFDTSNVTNMNDMFYACYAFGDSGTIDLNHFDTSNVQYILNFLYSSNRVKTINVDRFNMSNLINASYMFYGCNQLINIDVSTWNVEKANNLSQMFGSCNKLSDESLNGILKMCTTADTLSSSNKTLSYLGLTSTYYSASRIQALSNYQDFIDAGWTIGWN